MEYVNFERLEEIKHLITLFLTFLTIPALAWWWNYIKSFFVELYEDDEDNNCCPHCHIHIDPEPPEDLYVYAPKSPNDSSGGGMAVPAMEIPQREPEYIE